jgi:hypothetical protein
VSLLLASLGVVGGMIVGRAIARAFRKPRIGPLAPKGDSSNEAGGGDAGPPLAGFPCQLGDVILVSHGDEAWLAGALVFRERLPMAVLFIAPDAGGDRAIYARPAPNPSLLWLAPLASDAIIVGREPPSAIEHEKERFERTRRLPFKVERMGTGAPDVGEDVIVAEYGASTGDRLVVVVGAGGARAWRGRPLEEGTYEVLPGKHPSES